MSIAPSNRLASFGPVTVGTVLLSPVPFPVNDPATDLTVTRTRAGTTTELIAGVDWSWTPATPPTVGGDIVLVAGAFGGDTFEVAGDYELARASTFTPGNAGNSAALNREFDRIWMSMQEKRRALDEALALAQSALDAVDEWIATAVPPGSLLGIATQPEAIAGTDNTKGMTSLRTRQTIDANAMRINADATALASAATVDLGSASNLLVEITGGVTILDFGAGGALVRLVRLENGLTINHSAGLILPGAVTTAFAAGTMLLCVRNAAGVWRVTELVQRGDLSSLFLARDNPSATGGSFSIITTGGNVGVNLVGNDAVTSSFRQFGAFTQVETSRALLALGSQGNVEVVAPQGLKLPAFTVATLPSAVAGTIVWCSNARVNGQAAAAGTGCFVQRNATAWQQMGTAAAGSHPTPLA
jgi:hypothetical protein